MHEGMIEERDYNSDSMMADVLSGRLPATSIRLVIVAR
jgi:hypothetical protein